MAADAPTGEGRGLHVLGCSGSRLWEKETLIVIANSRGKKMQSKRVSISPLELMTQEFLPAVVGFTQVRPENGQVVLRCDNKAARDVVESRRPRSARSG